MSKTLNSTSPFSKNVTVFLVLLVKLISEVNKRNTNSE